jgi:hypothetical protein
MTYPNHPPKPDTTECQSIVQTYLDELQKRHDELNEKAEEDVSTTDEAEMDALQTKIDYAQSVIDALDSLE